MKKILALILALLMILGTFASCGGKSSDKDDPDDEYEENEEETEEKEEKEEKETVIGENSESNAENDGGNTENGGNAENGGESVTCTQHTGGTATCKQKAVCSTCKQSYGELNLNNHVENAVVMQNNRFTHKKVFTCCGLTIEESHKWTNGVCLDCNQIYLASSGLELKKSSDGTSYVVYDIGTCTDTEILIPFIHEGLPVTRIVSYAFRNCDGLTSITIPDSVTSIGEYAFEDCTNLTSITIGNGVTGIDDAAFNGCSSLTSITVDESNTAYKSIDGNLYSKDGKTLIQYAIGKTDTSFVIPDSVTSIGDDAFYKCISLTSVTIGNSVTSIGSSSFSNCSSLTSVTIGNNVTNIGEWAFSDCSSLTSIKYRGTEEQWKAISKGNYWNYKVPSSCVITYNYTGE